MSTNSYVLRCFHPIVGHLVVAVAAVSPTACMIQYYVLSMVILLKVQMFAMQHCTPNVALTVAVSCITIGSQLNPEC